MSVRYENMIKILKKCAEEKDISSELIKKIYDLEKDTVHQNYRDNETKLRIDILKSMKEN